MTSSPLQLRLSIELPHSRPLLPMEAAMSMLDAHEDEVLALIEDGHIAWAWDIKSNDAERREIRIWRDSLLAHAHGLKQSNQPEISVIDSFLPHCGPDVRSTQIQRLFTCSQWLVQALINQKLLKGLNEARPGRYGYVRVTRESVISFLRTRRIV